MRTIAKLIVIAGLILTLLGSSYSAPSNIDDKLENSTAVNLLREMIGSDLPDQIASWHNLMPPQPSETDQAQVVKQLPATWLQREVRDQKPVRTIKDRIAPALNIYGKTYKIILLEYDKPVLIIDTDSVLIITTEVLKISRSDDELLGLILHEVSHSIFRKKSDQIKRALNSGQREDALKNLALIELMCDTIAAYTLKSMGRDPLAFLQLVVRSETMYTPDRNNDNYHPSGKKRLAIISKVLNQA